VLPFITGVLVIARANWRGGSCNGAGQKRGGKKRAVAGGGITCGLLLAL